MQSFFNSLGVVVIGVVLSFLCAWFWFQKNAAVREKEKLAKDHAKLTDRVGEMEKQLSHVGASILPINAAFQAILIKELTHFHTPRMDELMVKLGPPVTLTDAEAGELELALRARQSDMDEQISDSEREAAQMLPLVMRRVKREYETLAQAPTQLKLVTVVPDAEEEEAK